MSQPQGKFSKILVAVDGSGPSIDASRYAINIARLYESRLMAISVLHTHGIRSVSSSFITAPTYGLDIYEKEREEAQACLNVVKNMADAQGVDLRTEIVEGSMSVEGSIVDYAENNGVDLIVVGTRGKTGFKRLLLGSVASGVITYAHCPVVVIK